MSKWGAGRCTLISHHGRIMEHAGNCSTAQAAPAVIALTFVMPSAAAGHAPAAARDSTRRSLSCCSSGGSCLLTGPTARAPAPRVSGSSGGRAVRQQWRKSGATIVQALDRGPPQGRVCQVCEQPRLAPRHTASMVNCTGLRRPTCARLVEDRTARAAVAAIAAAAAAPGPAASVRPVYAADAVAAAAASSQAGRCARVWEARQQRGRP